MTPASLARLLLLSAIWGASFLFIRIGSPALGPVAPIEARVLLAALFLAVEVTGFSSRLPALRKEAANG